jgi:uncharacterized protein (DUF1697 family)
MALVAFLRGVNVGGHRTFRPSALARELGAYDVVSVGAAGTFVVRRPGSRAEFRAELLRRLPFDAHLVLCDGREVRGLVAAHPFAMEAPASELVRFVSVLPSAGGTRPPLPATLPPHGNWFVRVLTVQGRFAVGVYRRHMKTIGYLGRLDRLFGAPVTTRSWTTINAVVRILESAGEDGGVSTV